MPDFNFWIKIPELPLVSLPAVGFLRAVGLELWLAGWDRVPKPLWGHGTEHNLQLTWDSIRQVMS